MSEELYPLKFDPILKEKIWGGKKLEKFYKKKAISQQIGESWEVSDIEGDSSIIANGLYKGKSLSWLQKTFKQELVGDHVFKTYGNKFPLLIKFIDAAQNLSVQLHPDDEVAKEKHNSFGKTEMWYIMQADENASLILGFKEEVSKNQYLNSVNEKNLPAILNYEKVEVGDAFLIKPGLIHAIGEGVVLAEIQQTSDITYRIYDWDRVTDNGKKRDLHQEEALASLDLSFNKDFKIPYSIKNNGTSKLIHTPYFKTDIITLSGKIEKDYKNFDSFIIMMGVEGEANLIYKEENYSLNQGETILIPANTTKITLEGINAKILKIHV